MESSAYSQEIYISALFYQVNKKNETEGWKVLIIAQFALLSFQRCDPKFAILS